MVTTTAARASAVPPDEGTASHSGRPWARIAIVSVGVGSIIRIIWGLALHPAVEHVYSDMLGYVERAARVAVGADLTRFDVFYPPGTHLLLSIPMFLGGTGRTGLWLGAVVWTALSAAVPVLTWLVARRLVSPPAAAVATVLTALWPLYVTYGGFFLSEIPSVALLLLTLWLALRAGESQGRSAARLAGWAGAAGGVTLAIRPQLALNVAIAAVVLLAASRPRRRVAVTALVGLAVPLGLVLAHNAAAAGRPVGLSENGALNFFQGHCPVRVVYMGHPAIGQQIFGSPVAVQLDRGRDWHFRDHLGWDQGFYIRRGLECIAEDGIAHVGVVARNVADLGMTSAPWPQAVEPALERVTFPANVAYMVVVPPLAVMAVPLARRRWRKGDKGLAIVILHLVTVLPTAAIFYGDPRFRVPTDVFGFMLVGAVAVEVLGRWRARRDIGSEPAATGATG